MIISNIGRKAQLREVFVAVYSYLSIYFYTFFNSFAHSEAFRLPINEFRHPPQPFRFYPVL